MEAEKKLNQNDEDEDVEPDDVEPEDDDNTMIDGKKTPKRRQHHDS